MSMPNLTTGETLSKRIPGPAAESEMLEAVYKDLREASRRQSQLSADGHRGNISVLQPHGTEASKRNAVCSIPNASRKSNGDVWSALRWYFYFYLQRGELPGCLLRLQRGVAPNAYRLALLYARTKQASYRSGSCGYLCIALGSGGTICLSPVDKLISGEDLFLFLIHSSDLQEVFCLAMLIIVQPSFLALNTYIILINWSGDIGIFIVLSYSRISCISPFVRVTFAMSLNIYRTRSFCRFASPC